MKTESSFDCPLCKAKLLVGKGDGMNPLNGVTVWCDTCLDCGGHGKDEKSAAEIFKQKCGFRNNETEKEKNERVK